MPAPESPLTQTRATINLFKGYIGAGLLSLPWAMEQLGMVTSIFGMLIIAVLNYYGVTRFIRCDGDRSKYIALCTSMYIKGTDKSQKIDYSYESIDLEPGSPLHGRATEQNEGASDFGLGPSVGSCITVGGPKLGYIAASCVLGAQIGTSAAYNAIPVTTINNVFKLPTYQTLSVLCVLYCLLAFIVDMSKVAYASCGGLGAYAVIFGLLYYWGLQNVEEEGWQPIPHKFHVEGLLKWIGIVIWSFEGINTAQVVYKSMQLKTPKKFYDALLVAYIIGFSMYTSVGIWGCLTYGEKVQSFFYFNFPDGWVVNTAKMSMVVVLSLTIPLQMYPVYSFIENLRICYPDILPHWYLIRVILVVVIIGIGILLPDPLDVISVVGAICFAGIGFILPGYCHMFTRHRHVPSLLEADSSIPLFHGKLRKIIGKKIIMYQMKYTIATIIKKFDISLTDPNMVAEQKSNEIAERCDLVM